MSTLRQEKVSSLIRHELGNYFLVHTRDFGNVSLISITRVRISPDLGHAKIYLSIFGGTDNADDVINRMKDQHTEIRHSLARSIGKQVRIIPTLAFYPDDSAAYSEKIDTLLKK